MPTAPPRIPADVRLFVAFLAVLVPARVWHTLHVRGYSIDGGYYLDVAQHVRDGQGLSTSQSLYNAGFEYFPHPTSVYPLWPWMLGMAGRLVDIHLLAHWLPLVLSFVAVCAAFQFGRALAPRPLFPTVLPGFHAGHLAALLLGLQREFVVFTSVPYTEGIAWALVFGFLWRAARKGASLELGWAVETAIWLGLAYLARAQLLVLPLAVAATYAVRLLLGPDRLRVARHALVALGGTALVLLGWWLHIRAFVFHANVGSLLRFDQNRANDLLHPIDVIVANTGMFDLLRDRLDGLLVAWDPLLKTSYQPTFFTMHWALPVAVPFALVAAVRGYTRGEGDTRAEGDTQAERGTRGLGALLARLRRPDAVIWILIVVFAFGSLLSVQLVHKHYNGAWYFSKRQGLMSLPAFFLPLWWLLRDRRGAARLAGVLILASTVFLGTRDLWTIMQDRTSETRQADKHTALVRWLQRHATAQGSLITVMDGNLIQRIAYRTHDVGYHLLGGDTSYADLLTMTDRLGARYVVVRPQALTAGWRFVKQAGDRLDKDFVHLDDEPDGVVILERRPGPPAPAGPEDAAAPTDGSAPDDASDGEDP